MHNHRQHAISKLGMVLFSLALVGGCGRSSSMSPTSPNGEDTPPIDTVVEAKAYAETVRIKLKGEGEMLVRQLNFAVTVAPNGHRTCIISGPVDSTARGRITECLKSVYPATTIQWK